MIVQDVSVTYRTTFERSPTLRGMITSLGRGEKVIREVEAVKDVSFSIPHGTVLGIVGANGAGKSTLVRTIAGILPPTAGRIDVYGRVSTLLALGVGFNKNLSGRDNVRLGGLAAGLHPEQLEEKYDEIVKFAELGDFMDMPMRTYSSGMYGRLAFSVAVNMDPDILIIDEALSVGDARFRRKSADKMRELCGQARTIVLVTHALGTVRDLCDQALWMNNGELRMWDEPEAVIDAYTEFLEVGQDAVTLEDV
ncbi:MAG TPA: ABC transporter ATP-binding protein, partial [Solirubrobacteraceae bacterium]|nr:ABC transporter ATP-binding protein [Solirubrobacteraceae bacterium]